MKKILLITLSCLMGTTFGMQRSVSFTDLTQINPNKETIKLWQTHPPFQDCWSNEQFENTQKMTSALDGLSAATNRNIFSRAAQVIGQQFGPDALPKPRTNNINRPHSMEIDPEHMRQYFMQQGYENFEGPLHKSIRRQNEMLKLGLATCAVQFILVAQCLWPKLCKNNGWC